MLDTLKVKTREIMNSLHIGMREHTNLDGDFIFTIKSNLQDVPAEFSNDNIVKYFAISKDSNRFNERKNKIYPYRRLSISEEINGLLAKYSLQDDYTKVFLISVILHELAHYYQISEPSKGYRNVNINNPKDSINYMKEPIEVESFAVQNYYLLQHFLPKTLKDILADRKLSIYQKLKKITTEAVKYVQNRESKFH